MKKALVIGAGGFIAGHLVERLKREDWYVVGLDRKKPDFRKSVADKFYIKDARVVANLGGFQEFDRVYQLAAEMGGAGYVFTGENDADILTNSLAINQAVLRRAALSKFNGKIFYSSSVCCYPDEVEGKEENAYPANPPSNYGWEKLTSERLYLAYAKNYGLDTRIARFHNTFGPYGTYSGGREKAPAAICRKVALAKDGGEIEIWGDGKQLRPFIYIDDLLDGIEALMNSDYKEPINLGPSEGITIDELVDKVSLIAGKLLRYKHIPGPTGGQIRNANCELAKKVLNWQPKRDLTQGLVATYKWIESQINYDYGDA